MTVLEAIQKSAEFLTQKGVESARLQAELLLAQVLQLPRMKLYLNFERGLTAGEVDQLRSFIKRRGMREPLQHILGSTSFCGLEITVNRHALVPRTETELLAEAGWEFLSRGEPAPAQLPSTPPAALDFGTGSGCVAIAIAVKCPAARLVAVDLSTDALELARQNAQRHGVAERVDFRRSDGFAALAAPERFDLIVSNPPYIPTKEIATLAPEVRDFDPRAALDGGLDGLDFYRRLAAEAADWLRPRGRIMLELGDEQGGAVTAIFHEQNWIVEAVRPDYTQRPRILIAKRG